MIIEDSFLFLVQLEYRIDPNRMEPDISFNVLNVVSNFTGDISNNTENNHSTTTNSITNNQTTTTNVCSCWSRTTSHTIRFCFFADDFRLNR